MDDISTSTGFRELHRNATRDANHSICSFTHPWAVDCLPETLRLLVKHGPVWLDRNIVAECLPRTKQQALPHEPYDAVLVELKQESLEKYTFVVYAYYCQISYLINSTHLLANKWKIIVEEKSVPFLGLNTKPHLFLGSSAKPNVAIPWREDSLRSKRSLTSLQNACCSMVLELLRYPVVQHIGGLAKSKSNSQEYIFFSGCFQLLSPIHAPAFQYLSRLRAAIVATKQGTGKTLMVRFFVPFFLNLSYFSFFCSSFSLCACMCECLYNP
jgi:hypothetical protein